MPEESFQITNGLAYDSEQKKIVAQPQTFMGSQVTNSDVAQFSVQGGQPSGWFILEDADFIASAIAVDGDGLLLGNGDTLYRYEYGDTDPTPLVDLSSLGVERIEGMALTADGHLYVVDGEDQELVEIAGWR